MQPVGFRRKIIYKSPREIGLMREAGKIVAEVLNELSLLIKEGTTTIQLDSKAVKVAEKCHGELAFFGYRGFPAHICTSVNEEVVHGIPDNRTLKNGDIVSIDVGIRVKEYHADAAATFPVGEVTPQVQELLDVCRKALDVGIGAALPNASLSSVSGAIQSFVESRNFSVVREYVGHGIGQSLHEEPQVPNFIDRRKFTVDVVLKSGITIAIEPMVNIGISDVEVLSNHWTVVTKDRKPSAHFEHTIAVTEEGHIILTQ
ncbi:MAG: type I methionyl aminopeptidase [Planctomycetota bacterium]